VSALVTYIGRTLIREVAGYVKSKNMKVCYNDTDSVFIVLGNENQETGLKLQDELNKHIKEFCLEKWNISFERNLLELKFEKLFRSMLVDTKKRYAGYLIWKKGKVRDEINITGIQARRSDSSLQVQYLQPKIIELILKDKTVGEIEKVIFEELNKIRNCIDYEYISLPVRLGKEKYANDIPKARGVEYAKEFLNLHLMVGMKPLLVYIKHGKEDALCFEHNKQLKGKEIKINIEKMCERNIFLPLQSILEIWKGEDYFNGLKLKIINILKGQRDLGDWSQTKSNEITPFH